jgi:NAD(P) transhydrogenase subunit beta
MSSSVLAINFAYVISAALFIFGLKMLSSPATARRGNMLSALGMLLAIVVTLFNQGLDYKWIVLGIVIGSTIGLVAAYKVEMTSMPEMVALFNGFGGISSLLLAWGEYHQHPELSVFIGIVASLSAFIGGITFSGSMIAFGKLSEKIPSKAIIFGGQHIINAVILVAALLSTVFFATNPQD